MDQSELMSYVAEALQRRGIPYAITGSHASSVFGETRFTNDIDVVIDLNSQQLLEELLNDFPEGRFYVSEVGARYAVSHGGQFNIIHEDSSQKVDLIIPEKSNWPDQLARRIKISIRPGEEIYFVAPEDLILKKMDFYREGGSEKHLRDIAGTLKISAGNIDLAYITDWSAKLGLSEIWTAIVQRVG